ncbi:MAG: FapA family protein [Helicobacteraceae bacterium]|nr:FapA family protein [Helicobacteraceae bacterium]
MEAKRYDKTFTVKTASVAKSLSDLAEREHVAVGSIDFDLVKVRTYVRESDEYKEIDKACLEKLKDKAYLQNPKVQFLQEYEARFRPTAPQPFRLNISAAADKFRTMAEVIIKQGSIIQKGVEPKTLYTFLNKFKLKQSMIIYLFDDELRTGVKEMCAFANGKPTESDFKLVLARWLAPVETVNDAFIWHYRQKEAEAGRNDRINYAERGFVTGISAGELIAEYISPKKGENGRSFDGRVIEQGEPKIGSVVQFNADDKTIETQISNQHRRYLAKTDGFVQFDGGTLSIGKTISLNEVSLKTTGNIKAGLDRGIEIEIIGKTSGEEVIGNDMVVEANVITANGGVASGAVVMGDKISIGGSTHMNSELIAKTIEVNVLRGRASGEKVTVKSLEGGSVRAVVCEVEQAVGGEISAENVIVGGLHGKTRITATRSIVVKRVIKGENKLTIDPGSKEEDHALIASVMETIKELKKEIEELKRVLSDYTAYIAKNGSSFRQIQEILAEDKKNNIASSEVYIKMAREFMLVQKKQENAENAIAALESQITDKQTEIERFNKQTLEATVSNEGAVWAGHNEVVFRLPVLGMDYCRTLSDGARITKLSLAAALEGGYEIKLVYG